MDTDTLAIIPARGGSTGIPRKNLQLIAGIPLVVYSIKHALQTPSVTRVIVSTDDPEIATLSSRNGAEIVWRPLDISGETATSESALLHVLDHLRTTENYEPELVVFLQATSPLRRRNDIQRAIETFRRDGADSLFSAYASHSFVWRKEGDRLSSVTYDFHNRPRRQDRPEDLIENGSIYIFKPWVLRKSTNRLGGKIAVFRMGGLDSYQVDEPVDVEVIEQLLTARPIQFDEPDLRSIRLLATDFDGVLTDNRVLVDQDGRESVWCHRGDGWGINQLKLSGIDVLVISREDNPVVAARCRKLKIAFVQSCLDKLYTLQVMARERSVSSEHVAYIGNDVNDLSCMAWAGVPIAVADAMPDVRSASRLVTARRGGEGAVREVCDLILRQRQGGTRV